ncbi:transcription factor C subunit 6 [Cryptococcus neoformans]|nr:transcription factor C subunit 6 [Cryptococcus neoformans var. grubii]
MVSKSRIVVDRQAGKEREAESVEQYRSGGAVGFMERRRLVAGDVHWARRRWWRETDRVADERGCEIRPGEYRPVQEK